MNDDCLYPRAYFRSKRLDKEIIYIIRKLREFGYTASQISRLVGISQNCISHRTKDITNDTLYFGSYLIKVYDYETKNLIYVGSSTKEIATYLGKRTSRINQVVDNDSYIFTKQDGKNRKVKLVSEFIPIKQKYLEFKKEYESEMVY